jgi:RNA polymerase sigma-70 factor (ECF subfamily)
LNNSLPTTWNHLFVQYSEHAWDSLFRFSVSLCKDENEAEDLVQQTLLKGLQALPTFFKNNYAAETVEDAVSSAGRQGDSELRAHLLNWLLKICRNVFLDSRGRAHRKYSHFSLDDWQEEDNQDATGQTVSSAAASQHPTELNLSDAENAFFKDALDDDWKERFEHLNARQRSIIYLAAEDYSYKEIAQLLEIPIGTVMSTLSRAIAKLKKPAAT